MGIVLAFGLLGLFFLALFSEFSFSQDDGGSENKNYQLTLAPYLDDEIFTGTSYTHLFKITIKNKNCSVQDLVTVEYNITGTSFFKLENFNKKVGCSSYAETGEFTPISAGDYLLCGRIINSSIPPENYSSQLTCKNFNVIETANLSCNYSLSIKAEETLIYQQGQSIEFTPTLNQEDFPFTIDYWIEDLFGNLAKPKVTTANTNQKSWKTNIEETDKVLLIKAKVYPKCQDTNLSDNSAEKMFIVANKDFHQDSGNSEAKDSASSKSSETDSSIKIIKITPDDPTFGELVKAELEIYKGDTGKYSLSAWAESGGKEISEKTKVNLKDKYQTYKITLPIQLDPNCDLKIKEGKATIQVEGLDESAKETISLNGINKKLCSGNNPPKESESKETVLKEPKSSAQKSTPKSDSDDLSVSYEETNSPTKAGSSSSYAMTDSEKALADESSGIIIYQNSSEKAKKVILYLLVITLALLCLVLVRGK